MQTSSEQCAPVTLHQTASCCHYSVFHPLQLNQLCWRGLRLPVVFYICILPYAYHCHSPGFVVMSLYSLVFFGKSFTNGINAPPNFIKPQPGSAFST